LAVTTHSAGPDGGPRQLLADSRQLARRVRRDQRATWFPLLVLSAVTFAAVPVYGYGHYALTCRSQLAARACYVSSTSVLVYWPIALVLGYAAIAAFTLRRARARGVGTRALPYAMAGTAIAVVLGGAAAWAAGHPPIGSYRLLGLTVGPGHTDWLFQLLTPTAAIGLALFVLAAVDRSWALLLLAAGYVVFALLPISDLGWVITHPSPWDRVPRLVIGGGVLLLAGVLFALAQRPRPRAAA
jgi:predicted small integral membrane protein